MTEPRELATKVVKDSIKEIKVAMPNELSRSIRFTAAVHVYSWVIRKEKAGELIAWLGEHGFKNIQTDTPVAEGEGVEAAAVTPLIAITATADGSTSDTSTPCPPAGCPYTQSECVAVPTVQNGYYYFCNWNDTNNKCEMGTEKFNKTCCDKPTCYAYSESECSNNRGYYYPNSGLGYNVSIGCEWMGTYCGAVSYETPAICYPVNPV